MTDTRGEWLGTADNPVLTYAGTFDRIEGSVYGPDERDEEEDYDEHDDVGTAERLQKLARLVRRRW